MRNRETILVTGSSGLIGKTVVKKLSLIKNYDLHLLDRVIVPSPSKSRIKIFKGDLKNFEDVNKAMKGVTRVIHLAAPSSMLHYLERPLESSYVTTIGFLNVLEAMRKNDTDSIVYASTSAVYEGNDFPYRESMVIFPPDLKALTKVWNEMAARQYSEQYGFKTIGFRPFSVYGFGEESKEGYANCISLFAWAMINGERPVVWGDGTQTRDFIFVDDVADAFVLATQKDLKCEYFNLGVGIETSFNEVINIINRNLFKKEKDYLTPIYVPIPIKIYAHRLVSDMTHTNDVLGFYPKISVEEGIKKVIKYGRTLKTVSKHQLKYVYGVE